MAGLATAHVKRAVGEGRLREFFSEFRGELDAKTQTQDCRAAEGRSFAFRRQTSRAAKRGRFYARELESGAIDSFNAANLYVSRRSLTLDSGLVQAAQGFIAQALERFTSSYDEDCIQTSLDPSYLWNNWRFGPGASNGVLGTHAAEKITQPMSCTALCVPFVRHLRSNTHALDRYDAVSGVSGVLEVNGSRLTLVPKNETTMRTIAIEPSGNMAVQLAAGHYLESALRYIGLDIRKQQPLNKAMALRGSIDGSVATIDLKSASDLIGTDLVGMLMPSAWYKLLMSIRCQQTVLPDGSEVKLYMVSTMGNGFTFPLMTLILVSLIYAMRRKHGGPHGWISWKDTCVFGDDIIIPVDEYVELCDILSSAGLIVNLEKSFSDGSFRESCGGDYYDGYDVTPVYVKSLSNDPEIYIALNQVAAWSARHDVLLPKTLKLLKGWLVDPIRFVPEWEQPDSGFLTGLSPRRYKYFKVVKETSRLPPAWEEFFGVALAANGYLESGAGAGMFFMPRPIKTRYKSSFKRIPQGYLDGYDPLTRSLPLSLNIDFMAAHILS